MQSGGCHPVDGCLDGDGFGGAQFSFLAANVVNKQTGKTLFAPYRIDDIGGAKVAFVGMTLEGTPLIVTPSGIADYDFKDEADTVNALVPELKAKGADAIVVLLHEGGLPTGGYNECPGISGPIVDIVNRMDPAIDAVLSGHTHQAYNCRINNKLVTSAASVGRLITDVHLNVDKVAHKVNTITADNVIVTRDVDKDPAQTALIAKYSAISAPLENRVIGSITGDLNRVASPAGETPLGDAIADAQLAATDDPATGSAVAAFMNPGGVRADLLYAPSGAEAPGEVTYGESFTVQPFGNSLVAMTVTGAQIDTLLEQQWCNQAAVKVLQVSASVSYSWSASAPVCDRVDASTIKIGGVTVDPAASYRITVNSFLADGGDGFTVLRDGTDRLGGAVDLDAFSAYLEANSPLSPPALNRITVTP
jgi:5'-nucleotidase